MLMDNVLKLNLQCQYFSDPNQCMDACDMNVICNSANPYKYQCWCAPGLQMSWQPQPSVIISINYIVKLVLYVMPHGPCQDFCYPLLYVHILEIVNEVELAIIDSSSLSKSLALLLSSSLAIVRKLSIKD